MAKTVTTTKKSKSASKSTTKASSTPGSKRRPKKVEEHWLVRPHSIKLLWRWGFVVLALTVAGDLFVEHHPYFVIDGWFGFGAGFGLIACMALVFFSKFLGNFLKRPDTYYDR